ncbi:hypothetical protein ABAC460_20365 [Asticcacaulis sp. AC460]|uniref:hypothetical protein n=1 Tax=Asticcacaulis sp. AC460 TaxID=1282360 RepID=UPI0003C3B6F6|nr:hypothetical protein [Asticcacaulis sp. AC460]ESQ87380.1 hypothetical protein ABAC460_20365 [Asticcacaulis sp. AC460]
MNDKGDFLERQPARARGWWVVALILFAVMVIMNLIVVPDVVKRDLTAQAPGAEPTYAYTLRSRRSPVDRTIRVSQTDMAILVGRDIMFVVSMVALVGALAVTVGERRR